MPYVGYVMWVIAILITLSACDEPKPNPAQISSPVDTIANSAPSAVTVNARSSSSDEYRQVDWTTLIPEEDLDALLNPPSYIQEIEDGSIADQISSKVQNTMAAASDDRYQQALVSTAVVSAMDDQRIRIPGFIVPLSFIDEQITTEFFLVPYFGACLHMPPPPPNQTIYVEYPAGLKLTSLYEPFWIYGTLKTELAENDTATAAYSMTMHDFELYAE